MHGEAELYKEVIKDSQTIFKPVEEFISLNLDDENNGDDRRLSKAR